jgi:hypothetical protein
MGEGPIPFVTINANSAEWAILELKTVKNYFKNTRFDININITQKESKE